MPIRLRRRLRLWPLCWWHHPYGPYGPSPWWAARPTEEEEKEGLKDYLEMLKEEIKDVEEHIKELEKTKKSE